jgi:hypothetical protein
MSLRDSTTLQEATKTMRIILLSITLLCTLAQKAAAVQILAGTPEDKMFQRATNDTNADSKLATLMEFEKQFPHSKALPDVFLMVIDLYRQKDDRVKIVEYGEKVLTLDERNVTAMMVLARNYAMEGKNIDRAVALANQAVTRIVELKGSTAPGHFTGAQWSAYLQNTEAAARSILGYANSIKEYQRPR